MKVLILILALAYIGLAFSNFIKELASISDQPSKILIESDIEARIHSRVRRQEVTIAAPVALSPAPFGFACSTALFRRMDQCCKVPQLYPDNINAICTPQQTVLRKTIPVFRGIFSAFFPVSVRRWTLRKNLSAKNSTIKSSIEDICRVHCIFKQQRWLAPENYIDENLFYQQLAVLIPSGPYNTLLFNARTECSSIQTYGDPLAHVNNTMGQKCLLSPFRLLRCVKRSMMLAYNTCPGQLNTGQTCELAKVELRNCDIFSL
ncbi:uncharacterized protein LOC135939416 [Cloeon dipterum]|uniref:uncharacterized protein LOC135939416 n=1 Tax=Cloeon dipterum TaxID=197152 RepID=UPI00322099FA